MSELRYTRPEIVSLRNHPTLNELWLQQRLGEDPSLLGLGDLVLKDRERHQPGAGRLDLLFQDSDTYRRYEVEIQLGRTDESHIIRTIKYWDSSGSATRSTTTARPSSRRTSPAGSST